jgi:hypothetical protein
MSMFASRVTKTIPIPFEEGQTVTLQKLNGRHLEQAAQRRAIAAQQFVRDLGGAEFRRQLAEATAEAQPAAAAPPAEGEEAAPARELTAVEKAQADPLNGYDIRTLLYRGIKAWSLPESLKADSTGDIAALEDLDEEAREWFAREVLRLTKPALFLDARASEEAQVKDSSLSIGS